MTDEPENTPSPRASGSTPRSDPAGEPVELPVSPWQLAAAAGGVGLLLALVLMVGGTPAATAAAGVVLIAFPMLVARVAGTSPGYVTLGVCFVGALLLGLIVGELDTTSTVALLLAAATGAGAVLLAGQPAEAEPVERPDAVAEARQTSDSLRQQLRQSRDRADAAERAAQEARAAEREASERARKLDQRLASAALRLRDLSEKREQLAAEPASDERENVSVGADMQALHQQLRQAQQTAADREAEGEQLRAELDRLKSVVPETGDEEDLEAERRRSAELERELAEARERLRSIELDEEDEGLPSVVVNDEDEEEDEEDAEIVVNDEADEDDEDDQDDEPVRSQIAAAANPDGPIARAGDTKARLAATRALVGGTAAVAVSRRSAEPDSDGDDADLTFARRAAERVAETGVPEAFTDLSQLKDADLDAGLTAADAPVRSAAAVPTADGALAVVGTPETIGPDTKRPLAEAAKHFGGGS